MKNFRLIIALIIIAGCDTTETTTDMGMQPPEAEKIPKELVSHGDVRLDNYYWMKLGDEQKNASEPDEQTQKVISYLESENEYLDASMAHTEGLQETLYNEIVGRIKQTDESVPYFKNGHWYYTRYEEGKEYPIYCRKEGNMDADEQVMLNVNDYGDKYEFVSVGGLSVSPDNKYLTYGLDTVSRRMYTIYIKDLTTGEILPELINNTGAGAAWANDSRTFFYVQKEPGTLRYYKIFRHSLGTDESEDVEIYHEADETFSTYVYRSKSDQYIMIASYQTLSSEYRYLNADDPEGEFRIFNPRQRDHEYSIEHFDDKFYVVTNWDAMNFRLMETPVGKTNQENWKEVIAHRPDVMLSGVEVFTNYLVVSERKSGLRQLQIINQNSGEEHYLDFGEEAYVAYVSTNPEFETEVLRYGYQSMTTPNSTYDYNMRTKEKTLLKQQEVVGDFDPENYETKRLYVEARDGVEVPITMVYRKGMEKNGQNPLLLYGYGSYGSTIDPYFSTSRLSLLDRGFIFVTAHIRGGQINGRQWYEDGKMFKKKNTFNDFVDCADYLVDQRYTNPDLLFAQGGSAGGLLMGAVVNMRPELFRGVVAAVPFVDVITTMEDESIPLTTGEFDEWGNPGADLEQYEYIKSYSPYDNVYETVYPNMLVTTGFHDSQVQYWEPAKWVAKLRDYNTGDNKIYLYTEMESGHGGASGRFKQHKETAMIYAFMIDLAED
ncbi:MAG: S9 family peptidase [Cyclobacteriaceae bacterium]|jgi:oligopeptidase B